MSTILQKVRQAKQELNEMLSYNPIKIIYELLTNIPKSATKITWEFKKVSDGLYLKFTQNVATDISIVIQNFLTSEKLNDATHYNNKPKDTGGLFGTGLSLIDYFTSFFTFSTNGTTYDFKTDLKTKSKVTDEVVIEMVINLKTFKRSFIKLAKTLISVTDMFVSDRTHKIIVDGFSSTDNLDLSTPIQYPSIKWRTSTGAPQSSCDYDFIKDSKGNISHEHIISTLVRDTDYNVKLKDFQIGKLLEKPTGLNIQSDKPLFVLICDETNQIIGQTVWKGSYPVSVNNSIILARVSKDDLRWLFTSGDKYNGFHENLDVVLNDFMKDVLNRFYPDNNILEVVLQLWLYDVIVFNKLGKKLSDVVRSDLGLGWMNPLSEKLRKDIVHLEWTSDGNNRYDFFIWNAVNGKITKKTTKTLIECKRKGFNDASSNQLIKYLVSTANCTSVIGTSLGISSAQFVEWRKTVASIKGSGQLSQEVEFELVDILDSEDSYGFNNYVDEYTHIAMRKIEENKK
jgi:hypothetical protein